MHEGETVSYDQIVLPAEHCGDVATAVAHAEEQGGRPASTAAAALADRIGRRLADVLSLSPLEADGDVVAVPVVFRGVELAREVVHAEARAAGYGVLDAQLGIVFDPRAALPGTITTRDGELPALTPPALAQLVATMGVDDFVVATSDDPQRYAQTYRRSADHFDVERREGADDRHFATVVGTAAEVQALLDAWLRGDRTALDAVAWERRSL